MDSTIDLIDRLSVVGKRFVPPIDKTGLSTHKPCKESFKALWESIYGKSSWRINPWVWVVAFKRV